MVVVLGCYGVWCLVFWYLVVCGCCWCLVGCCLYVFVCLLRSVCRLCFVGVDVWFGVDSGGVVLGGLVVVFVRLFVWDCVDWIWFVVWYSVVMFVFVCLVGLVFGLFW